MEGEKSTWMGTIFINFAGGKMLDCWSMRRMILAMLALPATLAGAVKFETQPSLKPNPNPAVPLAAIVQFIVATPVVTTITIYDGKRKWDVVFDEKQDPAAGLPVV